MLRKFSVALVAIAAIVGLSATAANAAAPVKPTPTAGFTAVAPHLIGGGRVTPNSFGTCTSGQGCAYIDANGGGSVYHMVFSTLGANTCHNLPAAFGDAVSSTELLFGSGYGVVWFLNPNCSGDQLAQPHLTDANMNDFCYLCPTFRWNDAASSFEIVKV